VGANLRTIGYISRKAFYHMLICCCIVQASEKQHRKSVAFSNGTTEIHQDGKVTEVNGTSDKTSAESHTACEEHNREAFVNIILTSSSTASSYPIQ